MNKSKSIESSKKIIVSGIENLLKQGIRFNKKTVTIPISNWELIEAIIKKIKLEFNP